MPRGCPDELLTDVVIRGAEAHGRGFVAVLLAVAWPQLGRRAQIVSTVLGRPA